MLLIIIVTINSQNRYGVIEYLINTLATLNIYVQPIFDVLDHFASRFKLLCCHIKHGHYWIMPNELLFILLHLLV